MLVRRLKQCAVVLVVLLIIDAVYLLYTYRPSDIVAAAQALDPRK